MRIGHGFDLHRLQPAQDSSIALAGVRVPCAWQVVAHSDGDVSSMRYAMRFWAPLQPAILVSTFPTPMHNGAGPTAAICYVRY